MRQAEKLFSQEERESMLPRKYSQCVDDLRLSLIRFNTTLDERIDQIVKDYSDALTVFFDLTAEEDDMVKKSLLLEYLSNTIFGFEQIVDFESFKGFIRQFQRDLVDIQELSRFVSDEPSEDFSQLSVKRRKLGISSSSVEEQTFSRYVYLREMYKIDPGSDREGRNQLIKTLHDESSSDLATSDLATFMDKIDEKIAEHREGHQYDVVVVLLPFYQHLENQTENLTENLFLILKVMLNLICVGMLIVLVLSHQNI